MIKNNVKMIMINNVKMIMINNKIMMKKKLNNDYIFNYLYNHYFLIYHYTF